MKNIILGFVLGLMSLNAQAQYSCSDIPNIAAILAQLQQSCGNGGGGSTPGMAFCRAKGYVGQDPITVINQCSASDTPYSRETCAADLNCTGPVNYCISKGYIGRDVFETMAACSASDTPYSRETCMGALVCRGYTTPYCSARGYLGHTPEEAMNLCSASDTPYSRETCSQDLTCH